MPIRSATALLLAVTLVQGATSCRRSAADGDATAGSTSGQYSVALIGDQQYRPATEGEFDRMMSVLDTANVAFVVHVGDIKAGATPCSDSLLTARRDRFDRSAHPFVFLFGDNEWADCYTSGYDPLERLAKLRTLFASGTGSLGRTRIALERQSANAAYATYRENVRWERSGVLFVGINVPGTSQSHRRTEKEQREYEQRTAANVAWIRDGFRVARERSLAGVMVLMQANPMFERDLLPIEVRARFAEHDPIIDALRTETVAFGRPVVLVHGDFHTFTIDTPLRDAHGTPVPNFTRVEVYGDPYAHWVRATIDTADPRVFRIESQLVPGNTIP